MISTADYIDINRDSAYKILRFLRMVVKVRKHFRQKLAELLVSNLVKCQNFVKKHVS